MGMFSGLFQMGGRNTISGSEARRMVTEENAVLVDVRSAMEFASGHVTGAVNIPVQILSDRLHEIPSDKPVVVYCASGARSAMAAQILGHAGFAAYDGGGVRNMIE